MKSIKTTILLFTIWIGSYGQDGSDIKYLKPFQVDSSIIGQYIHLDFFNRSFGPRNIDTVNITIDKKSIRFKEVRKDDGHNNWFSQQHLQSIGYIDGQIRISKFILNRITTTSFQVTMYLDIDNFDNELFKYKTRQIDYWFDKKDIAEVLVKNNKLSSQYIKPESITPGNPFFIQYNYGTCYTGQQRQITIASTHSDSLLVTIKKYVPVAYRIYKYKASKKAYEAQDSIQIIEPFIFEFPKMRRKDYRTVTKDYLVEASFNISRSFFTGFLNEFIYQADNNKLELSGAGIGGLYCYIKIKQSQLVREYTFNGWYSFEEEIQRQK
jgi:hypothetical protein